MSDRNYVWDKSGPVDPDVESLEETLAVLRHRGSAPHVPVRTERRSSARVWAAAAAIAAVALGAVWLSRIETRGPQFRVTTLGGTPDMCSNPNDPETHVPVESQSSWSPGDWLVTDSGSTAHVLLGEIGQMEVASGSQIQLVRASSHEQRFALRAGRIAASVNAPPRLFVIETPAATAYDLGCEYALTVDEEGGGQLHVTSGWVEMVDGDARTVVPADAFCQTHPQQGPGLAWVDGAPTALVHAIEAFDRDPSSENALVVLEAARARDSITLWHLVQRTHGDAQKQVFDRLHAQVPTTVTRPDQLNAFVLEDWLFALLDEYWIVEKPERGKPGRQNF